MKTTRILIADDHAVVREGVRSLIETQPGWEVCGEAATGREAVEQARALQPDIVVLDHAMPEINGLEAARLIRQSLAGTEVLMFTGHESDALIREVFETGAKSYIMKTDAGRHLVAALTALSQHKPFFTDRASEVVFARFLQERKTPRAPADGDGRLTEREWAVVRLLAEGKTNKEAGEALRLSVRTVENHRAAILRKLHLNSLAALVRYAIRNGIIEA